MRRQIPKELEARIDSKLEAFKGRPNDDATHQAIVRAIEEELHRGGIVLTPHDSLGRTITITYADAGAGTASTIEAVRYTREPLSELDAVKEALTDYAHASGRRVQPVHEVAAACDQERREAVQARDAALEELVAIRAALGIPGGMNTIEGLAALLAGVRRVRDTMRDGFAHVIGAVQSTMPDDGGMTDTTDPADVKAKADQVLALLEREPASHATTEILAREVRRLRKNETQVRNTSWLDALADMTVDELESPDPMLRPTPLGEALTLAHRLTCEKLGLDPDLRLDARRRHRG